MDSKYRITVTDLETGRRADYGGLPGTIDTSLGLLCALGGKAEQGDAFYCAVIADYNRGVSRNEILHLFGAVFHAISVMGQDDKDPGTVFSLAVMAFVRYVEAEIRSPALRYALFKELADQQEKAWEAERK